MDGSMVRRYRVFFPWQDEQEESWLRKMARDQGLHLVRFTPPAVYRFRQGERRDFVYRLDFQRIPRQALADYLQLFEDAGWEHVGEMNGWHYFRRPVAGGEVPEIFTDPESKAQKYRRILALHAVLLAPLVVTVSNRVLWERHTHVISDVIRLFALAVLLLLAYSALRVLGRVGQLTRQARSVG